MYLAITQQFNTQLQQVRMNNSIGKLRRSPVFGSTLFLIQAEDAPLEKFSEQALRVLLVKIVPKKQIKQLISIINTFKEILSKNTLGDKHAVSIEAIANNKVKVKYLYGIDFMEETIQTNNIKTFSEKLKEFAKDLDEEFSEHPESF